jgi:hypothetical protein
MDENRYIISNIIRGVITQLAALENNGKLDIFLAKKADEETKVEIKDFIRLYNGKDNGIYNEKINNLIDKNNNNNKDKDNAYSILTNMEYVFLNTIEEAKEEEKKQKQKAKSEGFAKVQTQARVKAQTAGKNISTPKPVPKNKKATNK